MATGKSKKKDRESEGHKRSSSWVMPTKGAELQQPKQTGGMFRFQPKPWRFRISPDNEAGIIFLHDYEDSLPLQEHRFDTIVNGKPIYGNALTCAQMVGEPCPLCNVKKRYDLGYLQAVRFFSIIDTRPYKPKKGPEKKYSKLVLAQPYKLERSFQRMAAEALEAAEEKGRSGDLRGAFYQVYRNNDNKSPAVGTEFKFKKFQKLKGSSLFAPEDVVPFTDDDFAVDFDLLEDAASLLTERANYNLGNDDDDDEEDDIPY